MRRGTAQQEHPARVPRRIPAFVSTFVSNGRGACGSAGAVSDGRPYRDPARPRASLGTPEPVPIFGRPPDTAAGITGYWERDETHAGDLVHNIGRMERAR